MGTKDKRKDWLAELKVGDEVAVPFGWREFRIAKITPSGMIDVLSRDGKYTKRFNPDGSARGASTGLRYERLHQLTPEMRDSIRRQIAVTKISNAARQTDELAKTDLEDLEEAARLLDGDAKDGEKSRQEMAAEISELKSEVERLQAELDELNLFGEMACQAPADDCDCAGCLFARDPYEGNE